MNEAQKDYTIKKITEYNERIDELYFGINRNTLFAFCGVGLAIAIFAINVGEFSGNETLDNFVGVTSAASTVLNGISAVKKICEKAGLEHTVRTLEHQIAMSDLEQPKQYVKEHQDK